MPDEYESPQTRQDNLSCTIDLDRLFAISFQPGIAQRVFGLQAETIFPAAQSTAPSLMMPSSPNSAPRRGPGMAERERRVKSWPIWISSKEPWVDCLAFWNEITLCSLAVAGRELPFAH